MSRRTASADAHAVARLLASAIQAIPGLIVPDYFVWRLGIGLARRGRDHAIVGEQLGIIDQFQGVDQMTVQPDGSFEILERIEGGRHLVSQCQGPPMLLGWATGNLPEPRNNPQVGMANMRTVMPALQKARARSAVTKCRALPERGAAQAAAANSRRER